MTATDPRPRLAAMLAARLAPAAERGYGFTHLGAPTVLTI